MLWFFERDDQALRLEVRYDNDTSEYVALVTYPDGNGHTERFSDGDQFRMWLELFEHDLAARRWSARTGPVFLPYGWPNKRLT
jgi:hypothetical protein